MISQHEDHLTLGDLEADYLTKGQSPRAEGLGASLRSVCIIHSLSFAVRDRLPSDISEYVHDLLDASEEI